MKLRNVVRMPLSINSSKVGELVLTTAGDESDEVRCDIGPVSDISQAVHVFDDVDGLITRFHGKDQDPIVLIRHPARSMPHLFLLEDCVYYIKIVCEQSISTEGSFCSFRNYGLEIVSHPFSKDEYEVKFAGYAGRGIFDIYLDGKRVEIPFEVRSSKIEYLIQYPKMISDISDFYTALSLYSDSPLSQRYNLGADISRSYYEDFILIEAMFSKMGLNEAFRFICENKHESVSIERIQSFGCEAYSLDSDSVFEMISSNGLVRNENGYISSEFNPVFTINTEYNETYDNIENRLVKDFLLYLQYYLSRMKRLTKNSYIG